MTTKSKTASDTRIFSFLLSKIEFLTKFKKLFCIQSVLLVHNFHRKKVFPKTQNGVKNQNGGFLLQNRLLRRRLSLAEVKTFQQSVNGKMKYKYPKNTISTSQRIYFKMAVVEFCFGNMSFFV
jgi:hypothetical protein